MQANTYPLSQILLPDRRYLIPTFQRDYEWTQEGQWELLFEDLSAAADRLLDARSSGETGQALLAKEALVSPHFLGAIVVAPVLSATGGITLRSVIDGQQRLTTSQLLLRGVLDVLSAEDSLKQHQLRDMLYNKPYLVTHPDETYKLWPRRNDRKVWPEALVDDESADLGGDHLYFEARKFFAESSRTYVTVAGQAAPARMDALADALSTLFKLVVIDLEENDDAQVIFEVLNGRQSPLAAIDLVKNLLFLRGELAEADVDTLYDKYWAHFDEDWWKEEVGRGHAARGRRDVLLSVWLTAETGKEASVGHLYGEARTYLNNGSDTETILKQLAGYADAYEAIYDHVVVSDARLRTAYKRIRTVEVATAVPLLAWLRTLPASSLSPENHVRAVRAVESWVLRRIFLKLQTRGYGTHLARTIAEAKSALVAGEDVANAVIQSLQRGALGWPSDDEVEEAFRNSRFYNAVGKPRIVLLLSAIDSHLRANDPHQPDANIDYSGLEIEHVMPQSWEPNWPISQDGEAIPADPNEPVWLTAQRERDSVVDRIGNLTLVTGSFNGQVSHGSWLSKRVEFAKQNTLAINFSIANTEDWDEGHIESRAKELAKIAIEIWPAPGELSLN